MNLQNADGFIIPYQKLKQKLILGWFWLHARTHRHILLYEKSHSLYLQTSWKSSRPGTNHTTAIMMVIVQTILCTTKVAWPRLHCRLEIPPNWRHSHSLPSVWEPTTLNIEVCRSFISMPQRQLLSAVHTGSDEVWDVFGFRSVLKWPYLRRTTLNYNTRFKVLPRRIVHYQNHTPQKDFNFNKGQFGTQKKAAKTIMNPKGYQVPTRSLNTAPKVTSNTAAQISAAFRTLAKVFVIWDDSYPTKFILKFIILSLLLPSGVLQQLFSGTYLHIGAKKYLTGGSKVLFPSIELLEVEVPVAVESHYKLPSLFSEEEIRQYPLFDSSGRVCNLCIWRHELFPSNTLHRIMCPQSWRWVGFLKEDKKNKYRSLFDGSGVVCDKSLHIRML